MNYNSVGFSNGKPGVLGQEENTSGEPKDLRKYQRKNREDSVRPSRQRKKKKVDKGGPE